MKDIGGLKTIIISAVVTGVITLLTTLVINYFTSKKNKLSYITQTSIPFQKDSLNVRIYNLDLINDGDEVIEGIKGVIKFDNQEISDYKLKSSPVLAIHDTLSDGKYEISIGSLNPSEKVTVSFLISSPNYIDSLPKVDFRAKGLSAKSEEVSDKKDESSSFFYILLFGVLLALFPSSFLLFLIKKKRMANGQHSDDQSRILSYLCGVHGLLDESERYLNKMNSVNYWSEADYFGNLTLQDINNSNNEKRLLVLLDLLRYAKVSDESIGIIYYNIAKVYKIIGNSEKSNEYLTKAKKIIPKLIENRLTIDKVFLS
jgi:hypothetical protein